MRQLLYLIAIIPPILFGQTQIGNDIDGSLPSSFSGTSTSISSDGTIVAIGAPNYGNAFYNEGQIRLFENIGNSWLQLGNDITGTQVQDKAGQSISLSSDGLTLAVGAPGNADNGFNSGQVRLYGFSTIDQDWILIGNPINGENAYDFSGISVSLSDDGQTVAIGATFNNENGNESGQVRVYRYDNVSDDWQKIGNDINGSSSYASFGSSVSLSANGNILAVGATGYGNYVNAYQYNEVTNNWDMLGASISGENLSDKSGTSISLSDDGSILAIGAPDNDGVNGNGSGHVRIYQYNANTISWSLLGDDIDGEAAHDAFGTSVSLSADGLSLAVGALGNDGPIPTDSSIGHVRFFNFNSDTNNWVQLGNDIDGERTNDYSGTSVSLSADGSTVAIGAPGNDGSGSNSDTDQKGHVRVYNLENTLSTGDNHLLKSMALYPNPAISETTIILLNDSCFKNATVYNALGQKVLSSKAPTIQVHHLEKGIYYVEVITRNNQPITKKLIKK